MITYPIISNRFNWMQIRQIIMCMHIVRSDAYSNNKLFIFTLFSFKLCQSINKLLQKRIKRFYMCVFFLKKNVEFAFFYFLKYYFEIINSEKETEKYQIIFKRCTWAVSMQNNQIWCTICIYMCVNTYVHTFSSNTMDRK